MIMILLLVFVGDVCAVEGWSICAVHTCRSICAAYTVTQHNKCRSICAAHTLTQHNGCVQNDCVQNDYCCVVLQVLCVWS